MLPWNAIAGMGIIFLVAGCLAPAESDLGKPNPPLIGYGLFAGYADTHEITIEETKLFFQEVYGLKNEEQIFAKIPPLSNRMESIQKGMMGEEGNAMKNIPESIYLRPEFYPTYSTSGVKTWTHAPPIPAATIGIGGTPGEQKATIPIGGGTFETVLFVTSAWGSTYYQGMTLAYRVEPAGDIQLEFNPSTFVLGPAFPQFDEKWAQKVEIRGEVGSEVGEGNYQIFLYPALPSGENEKEWREKYAPYIHAAGAVVDPEGIGTLFLTIEGENE